MSSWPFDEEALVGFLSDASCYLFLAVEGGKVLGSLNGYRLRQPNRREPEFLLYEIDVRRECRRRGVGRALVDAFAAEAQAAGAFEVWLLSNEANEAAMALYRRCGFLRLNEDDVMLMLLL